MSWGVGPVTGWSYETHGCADALVFRVWLESIPEHEYAVLVHFCLANPGVAAAIQAAFREQLWLLCNGGHPRWLPSFNGALERVADAPVPQETLISAPSSKADVLTKVIPRVVCPPRTDKETHIEIDYLAAVESGRQ